MTATREEIEKVAMLVKNSKIALLTTVAASGQLVSRPLAVQKAEFDGDLWFLSQHPSEKTAEIAENNQVNVAMESGKGYLSIAGTASVLRDQAKIDELWSPMVEAWFPHGKDDAAVIRVTADAAEYWSADEPKPVALLKVAAAAMTGKRPDIGDNETVTL